MIREAIILAGGTGTRLKSVIADVPKPMAPVDNRPFLAFLLDDLARKGINRVVLSVGYKHEVIEAYFGQAYNGMELVYCIETEPLGTGGGIKLACSYAKEAQLLIVNGDTFFDVDIKVLFDFHENKRSIFTIALKAMQDFDRYGTVVIDDENRIKGFIEKQYCKNGLINGGIYILEKALFNQVRLPEKFSFEKEVMEHYFQTMPFYGYPVDRYFIDIGIPEDYQRAQNELKGPSH